MMRLREPPPSAPDDDDDETAIVPDIQVRATAAEVEVVDTMAGAGILGAPQSFASLPHVSRKPTDDKEDDSIQRSTDSIRTFVVLVGEGLAMNASLGILFGNRQKKGKRPTMPTLPGPS